VNQRGFTLIEVLCALAILALVLGASLRILGSGTASAGASRDYARLLAVASAHLAALQAADAPAALERSGADGDIAWRESMAREQSPAFADPMILAWRLDASARIEGGREVALTSVRLERKP
jgi:type II secretion system protein I